MSRYIDADKLYELIRTNDYKLATKNGSIDYGMFTVGIKQAIDKIPTADVKEVKHGEWITDKDGFVTCSECGEEHTWDDFRPTFCDMCGARMDDGRLKND